MRELRIPLPTQLHPCAVLATALAIAMPVGTAAAAEPQARFHRVVRQLLADKCFRCHGPDAAARQADLRLDDRRDATADRGGYRVIETGQPARSELMRRVTSTEDDQRMPPPDAGPMLRPDEIEVLRRWIQEGAEYQPHWSFVPPRRPVPPQVRDRGWSHNAIDRFVLSRLQQEGLEPSAEADPATLIRRVTLDLTGLPPTPDEIDAFEWESRRHAEAAYRRLVDRLLASPRYGERMAVGWLDAARYADTNGYFTDNERTMWPWRDWVINALNDNMPFDRFTIEQLAGDLAVEEEDAGLPGEGGRHEALVATGFNRNHMVNNETGIIEEEFRVEYVVDRVDTTATVWMGLTLGCARCHDHKYDPISQQEFYRFFSFFNNVPERGLSGSGGNAAPLLKVPSPQQQLEAERLRREVAAAERRFVSIARQLDDAQAVWEMTAVERLPKPTEKGLVAHYPLDDALPAADTTGHVATVAGLLGNAAELAGDASIQSRDAVDFERTDAFSWGAWIQAAGAGCIISKTDDADDMRGFDLTLRKGKAIVNLVNQWNRNAIQVATVAPVPSGQWRHLLVTYDGSGKAEGVRVYLDGQSQAVAISQDNLTGSIRNGQPLRIGRRQASASYSGLIDDVRLYDRQLTAAEVDQLASSQLVRGIIARPPAQRGEDLKRKLRAWFVERHADKKLAAASAELDRLRHRETRLLESVPTTMVMREAAQPRPTFLLVRGQYDQQGEEVWAGVPAFITSSQLARRADDAPADRLDLAKWLVDPAHPLTARVAVNRLWQTLFGVGIVKTADDFGTQGDWPSHPELLDWLAVELIELGWDVKQLLRLMVTSATYRQSSEAGPELFRRDPENRLLARGPRFRMSAEMLRDNALAISGLLVEKLGGPSVNPYQPPGLWEDVTYDSDSAFRQSDGQSVYRRSLYTFWKRQSPPPSMLVFDAPTRETCTIQRSRTNTPLQALVLMNDPTFVEASRKLAERLLAESAGAAEDRIVFAFRAATARRPMAAELKILVDVFRRQKDVFEAAPDDARQLLGVGESARNMSLDTAELAAWTTVASLILCLDEAVTKP